MSGEILYHIQGLSINGYRVVLRGDSSRTGEPNAIPTVILMPTFSFQKFESGVPKRNRPYSALSKLSTSAAARTSLFVPEEACPYLAVPHRGDQQPEIRV